MARRVAPIRSDPTVEEGTDAAAQPVTFDQLSTDTLSFNWGTMTATTSVGPAAQSNGSFTDQSAAVDGNDAVSGFAIDAGIYQGDQADPQAAGGAGAATLLTLNGNQATGFFFSGNQDIDADLIGSKWTSLNQTYSFPTSGSLYVGYSTSEPSFFTPFNAAQQQAVRYGLSLISSYTNLTFTEITETSTVHATHRFGQTTTSLVPSAQGHFPANTSDAGDVWFNDSKGSNPQPFYLTPAIGNWGQATIMHEIGHTLGLKHGHQDYTFVDLSSSLHVAGPRYGTKALPTNHDGQAWSLMTYQGDPSNVPATFNGDRINQPETYMQDDIAALQYLYGANFNSNATNTVYSWSPTTGQEFINGIGQGLPQGNKIFETIWDGNGNDTYDLSNYTVGVSIDLNPGQFSTFSSAQLADTESITHPGLHFAPGNIANALLYNGDLRSLIENADGGSGADTIIGNVADNVLRGEAGNDTIDGGAGNDTAVFSGLRSAYTLTPLGGTSERVVGPDGTDTVTNIERLAFDDQVVVLGPTPEIAVSGNGTNIVDGDSSPGAGDGTDFGSVTQGATVDHVFTVANSGTAALTTSGLTLPSGFILLEGLSSSIAAGSSDTFTVRLDTSSPGTKTGQISFIDNDNDENPFDFAITGTVTVPLVPEIAVSGNGTNIVDGASSPGTGDGTDFGAVKQGAIVDRVFTVTNSGTATLTTSGLTLPSGFMLVEGLSSSIAAGSSDTFTVRLDTSSLGTKTGQISFADNDSDENPFDFAITGVVNPGDQLVSSGSVVSGVVVSSGGTLQIFSSGIARGTTVLGGGAEYVFSGGVASGTSVSNGGQAVVSSGGVASGTVVSNGGLDIVAEGGVAGSTTVSAGGADFVYGTTSSGTTGSGGVTYVFSGGVASGATVASGGLAFVSGTLAGGAVAAGGEADVLAGGLASGTTVSAGGGLLVSSGGIASATAVEGLEIVFAGGIARGMVVSSGGQAMVSSGGAATGTVVSDGGLHIVAAGGVASGTVVSAGGQDFVYGTAVGGTAGSGGTTYVFSGGVASGATVALGGLERISGTMTGGTVGSGGEVDVFAGGLAGGTTVSWGGGLLVSSGGLARTTAVQGLAVVFSGGVASDTTVSSGGLFLVSSGSVARTTTVLGQQTVLSGGVASGTVVSNGGLDVVVGGGIASGTVVSSGSVDFVYGTAIGGTTSSGGVTYLFAGGAASGATVALGGLERVSGTMTDGTVQAGGEADVYDGGIASGTTVSAGGGFLVSAGGLASATAVQGLAVVFSGGVVDGTAVRSGGQAMVSSGGVASGTMVSNGGLDIVAAGGVASGTTVSSGGQDFVYGTAIGGTTGSGGTTYVFSDGVASGATVAQGGLAFVSGTLAGGTVGSGGEVDVLQGGLVSGTTISAGGGLLVSSGGVASATAVSGLEIVFSGGLARGMTLGSGAQGMVSSGGVASGTVVSNGGLDIVAAGGVASGTTVSAGGQDFVYGSATGSILSAGGAEYVFSGAVLGSATLSGGYLEIRSGATTSASTIGFSSAGGALFLGDSQHFGGTISGFGVPGSIDLHDIAFGSATTLGFTEAPGNTSGTLTVSDGTHTAALTLLGQYVAGNFAKHSDGNGGTLVTDPPVQGLAGQPFFSPLTS